MKRYLRITEYTWLVLAILCIGVTVYLFVTGRSDDGTFGLLITLFAGIMYSMRRRFNRHVERASREPEKKA
jgi:hypothetical protein